MFVVSESCGFCEWVRSVVSTSILTIPPKFHNTSEFQSSSVDSWVWIFQSLSQCQIVELYSLQSTFCVCRLEVWPGYVTTIGRYAGGLLLQLDASHRVLRTETVLDLMWDFTRAIPIVRSLAWGSVFVVSMCSGIVVRVRVWSRHQMFVTETLFSTCRNTFFLDTGPLPSWHFLLWQVGSEPIFDERSRSIALSVVFDLLSKGQLLLWCGFRCCLPTQWQRLKVALLSISGMMSNIPLIDKAIQAGKKQKTKFTRRLLGPLCWHDTTTKRTASTTLSGTVHPKTLSRRDGKKCRTCRIISKFQPLWSKVVSGFIFFQNQLLDVAEDLSQVGREYFSCAFLVCIVGCFLQTDVRKDHTRRGAAASHPLSEEEELWRGMLKYFSVSKRGASLWANRGPKQSHPSPLWTLLRLKFPVNKFHLKHFIVHQTVLFSKFFPAKTKKICLRKHWKFYRFRVPTTPGKPGKIGPYLENLEKQGVWEQNPGKILQNLEKNFDLTLKKPKNLNNIWIYIDIKTNADQARGPRFFFVCLDKGSGIISFC